MLFMECEGHPVVLLLEFTIQHASFGLFTQRMYEEAMVYTFAVYIDCCLTVSQSFLEDSSSGQLPDLFWL